jgi:hypothetical protein
MHGRKRVDPLSESDEEKVQRLSKIDKYKYLSSAMLAKVISHNNSTFVRTQFVRIIREKRKFMIKRHYH